jgi:flagellar hook-associated protein 2
VDTNKSLASVFDAISTATDGAVTASYDSTTDRINLQSYSNIVLGSSTDTSNFLQVAKLNDNHAQTLSSSSALGGIQQNYKLSAVNFATAVNDAGSGKFSINGVTISYSATNDTVSDVLTRINESDAKVTASFDSAKGQFQLTSKSTGDMGISLEDVSGNFLASAGLLNGTLARGQNLIYTVNDGGEIVSQSNTITGTTSGITGLSVTATKASSVTVTVTNDTEAVNTAINDFVTQYNKVQSLVDTYTASSTDASGKVSAGILAAESDATEISTALRNIAYKPSTVRSTTISSLDDLGITTSGNDDKLTVSSADKLASALSDNLNKVQDLFTNTTSGIAIKLAAYLDKTIGDEGSLPAKEATLTKQSSDIDTQIATIERQVQAYSDNMTQQFIAMETAQQKLKSQLQYLQQNLGLTTSSSSKSS